jgi:ABC-2 type transport system permease protein
MSTLSDEVLESPAGAPGAANATPRPTRPFHWSVRRELWENRSIWMAPAGVAAFAVAALVIHALTMPSHMPGLLGNDPGSPGSATGTYRVATLLTLVTAFVTGAFYCLEALSGERRDRSILFWKSLPVSDRTTVLAKATLPLVVLPVVTLAATVAMQLILLLLSAFALLVQGQSVAPLWGELQLPRMWLALPYAVTAATLWHAPVYAFLLLVSGWARRTAALWAVLPLLALGLLEKLTMDTTRVLAVVQYRLVGWYGEAFAVPGGEHIPFSPGNGFTPGRFVGAPGLWIGLVLAAVFLAGAGRMRRLREPV